MIILKLLLKQKYVTAISIIAIFLIGYIYFMQSGYKNKISELWDNLNKANELIKEANGSVSTLTNNLENSKDIEKILNAKINILSDSLNISWTNKTKQLLKIIKDKDEKLKSSTTIIAEYDIRFDSVKNSIQSQEGERKKVSFEKQFNSVFVSGYTLTDPAFTWLNIKREPLVLNLTVTENKNKDYSTYVTFSDADLKIKNINTKFIGYSEPITIWSKIKNSPRVSVGIFQDEAYLSAGFRVWRIEPKVRATSNGLSSGAEFYLLR